MTNWNANDNTPPPSCSRCGASFSNGASIMSKFNRDQICATCKTDEQALTSYAAADAAEVASVRGGSYNFDGVGLSFFDRECLAEMRKARTK
jgi:hypothetical protein